MRRIETKIEMFEPVRAKGEDFKVFKHNEVSEHKEDSEAIGKKIEVLEHKEMFKHKEDPEMIGKEIEVFEHKETSKNKEDSEMIWEKTEVFEHKEDSEMIGKKIKVFKHKEDSEMIEKQIEVFEHKEDSEMINNQDRFNRAPKVGEFRFNSNSFKIPKVRDSNVSEAWMKECQMEASRCVDIMDQSEYKKICEENAKLRNENKQLRKIVESRENLQEFHGLKSNPKKVWDEPKGRSCHQEPGQPSYAQQQVPVLVRRHQYR